METHLEIILEQDPVEGRQMETDLEIILEQSMFFRKN